MVNNNAYDAIVHFGSAGRKNTEKHTKKNYLLGIPNFDFNFRICFTKHNFNAGYLVDSDSFDSHSSRQKLMSAQKVPPSGRTKDRNDNKAQTEKA